VNSRASRSLTSQSKLCPLASIHRVCGAAKSVSLKVDEAQAVPRRGGRWQTYLTTISRGDSRFSRFDHITHNWNGGRCQGRKVTDDAYVRGALTPLTPKVTGIVRAVDVADYQQVHKGDLLVELQDDDYRA